MNDLERIDRLRRKLIEKQEQEKQQIEEENIKKIKELGVPVYSKEERDFHGDCDNPNTMENGTSTVLYIITMIVGSIFNDRWLIWIIATVMFIGFLTRHKRNKK